MGQFQVLADSDEVVVEHRLGHAVYVPVGALPEAIVAGELDDAHVGHYTDVGEQAFDRQRLPAAVSVGDYFAFFLAVARVVVVGRLADLVQAGMRDEV